MDLAHFRGENGANISLEKYKAASLTSPLGPLGFEGAQHRQTLRPSVDGVHSKALRPFGPQ